MAEEKKRLEAQINQLDEDLEEERTQNELMQEKVKRANLQVISYNNCKQYICFSCCLVSFDLFVYSNVILLLLNFRWSKWQQIWHQSEMLLNSLTTLG